MLSARPAGCGAALWLGLVGGVLCRAWTAPSASREYPPARSPRAGPRPCRRAVPPRAVPSPRCTRGARPGLGACPRGHALAATAAGKLRTRCSPGAGPRVVTLEMFLESCAGSWRRVGNCWVRVMRVEDGFWGVVPPLRSVCVCGRSSWRFASGRSVGGWKVTTLAEISFLFLLMVSTYMSTYLGLKEEHLLSRLDTYGLAFKRPSHPPQEVHDTQFLLTKMETVDPVFSRKLLAFFGCLR